MTSGVDATPASAQPPTSDEQQFTALLDPKTDPAGGGSTAAGADGIEGADGANLAQNSGGGINWSSITPGAMVYGVSTGRNLSPDNPVGVFGITPFGNLSNTSLFVSNPGTAAGSFKVGGVGTWTPGNDNQLEPGFGGVTRIRLADGTPLPDAAFFANGRLGGPIPPTGDVSASVNFGVLVSADQLVAKGLVNSAIALAPAAVVEPTPAGEGIAGTLAAAGLGLEQAGRLGSGWVGVGYRGEARWSDGQFQGIFFNGQKVDPTALLQDFMSEPTRYSPPVIPNGGNSTIAAFNYDSQLLFGSSPWDLGFSSGGLNHGNGPVAVANQFYSVFRDHGVLNRFEPIRDNAHARELMTDLRSRYSDRPDTLNAAFDRLVNRYDLDFGDPVLKFSNSVDDILGAEKPGDYQYTRDVFEGDYRYYQDNPVFNPANDSGGFNLRL
ncbi:MAG: hypothetical protein AAGA21_22475 [Pseudomonadota bacterium]